MSKYWASKSRLDYLRKVTITTSRGSGPASRTTLITTVMTIQVITLTTMIMTVTMVIAIILTHTPIIRTGRARWTVIKT